MDFFKQAYNQNTYLDFLADKFTFSKSLLPIDIDNAEVKSFERLGTITTKDHKVLPVFEIYVKPNTQLQRNRVQLRNLVAKQIQTEDGALAVYIDDQNMQWRFSFIAIEWKLTDEGVKEEQTASKRFTYLLGENTQTRTAEQQFATIDKQSTLEDLKQAFAVEPLNKEFYDDLYQWYETAQKQVVFPNDEHAENHAQTSLIRLLTRLLFIWFIKEKNLINADLFDQEKLKTLINYDQPSSFYKAILQNLFFATLNRPIIERSFRTTTNGKANKNNYLATNVYRYQDYFTNASKDNIIALFEQTPFLNGGLFECLDREASEEEQQNYDRDRTLRPTKSAIRMDGFSDRADNQLEFPNELFFRDDEQNYGLINLFKQYQFTVEESTPLDIEVALDPELLGKVFENLLASYNPETGQQARKATGSFYTPREIVSYMVDESIKSCLLEKAPPHDGDKDFYKERLQDLISLSDKTGELPAQAEVLIYPEEVPQLIKAISGIKIIDPAVGSGAFPMGLLQRMVALLVILDPHNEQWKQQKLAELPDLKSIEQDLKTSEKISDTKAKQQAQNILSAKKQQIIDDFKHLDHNYLRKLYLIENCIYGVDIQPVAIQICKLRFFISLTIEQNPNRDKNDNYGIKALPNLETRFIVANSLLPLGEMPEQRGIFDEKIEKLQNQLAEVRHLYFSAKTLKTKRKYREQDKALRQTMLEELTQSGITAGVEASMQKIVHWDLYNQNSVADWFNPEWQFGVKNGFDIVIGNPPYTQVKRSIYPKTNFPYSAGKDKGKQNLYKLFVESSYNLCKNNGVATMIVQSSLMGDLSSAGTRQLLLDKTQLQHLIEFPKTAPSKKRQVFDSVTQGTCIYQFVKQAADNFAINISINNDSESIKKLAFSAIEKQALHALYSKLLYFPKIAKGSPAILQKIANDKIIESLFNFVESIRQGDLNLTTDAKQFSKTTTPVKLMRGRHVERYKINYEMANEYIVAGFEPDKIQLNQDNHFLISQQITGTNDVRRLHFALKNHENEQVLWGNSINKILLKDQSQNRYFLALLNSKFMDWYFRITSSNNHVQGYEIEQLPSQKSPKQRNSPLWI